MITNRIITTLILLSLCTFATVAKDKAPKILYVTSLPGSYHNYVTQRTIFLETAKEAGWEVTSLTGSYNCLNAQGKPTNRWKTVAKGKTEEEVKLYNEIMKEIAAQTPLVDQLRQKDFGKGYDAIVLGPFCRVYKF